MAQVPIRAGGMLGCWDVGMLQWFDSVWLRSSWIPSWIPSWILNHLRYRFTEASGYCKNSDLWTAGSFYSESLHFAVAAWKFRSCKTLQLPRTKLMTSPWHHALDLYLCLVWIVCLFCLWSVGQKPLHRNRCTATVARGHSCPRCQTSFASNQRLGFMCLNDISPTNTSHISMFSASMDNISWLYGFSGLR